MRAISWVVLSAFFTLIECWSVRADSGRADGVSPPGEVQANLAPAASPQAETLLAFDQWAAQQDYYSRQMIVAMRARLIDAFASLSPNDATQLRDEFIAKLNILRDPQWQNVELWLAETLAVASDSYAETILASLPDIVADSPGQTRAKLRNIANRAINLQQVRQVFDQTRQATIQANREDNLRQAQFNAHLRASMTYSTPNLYSPTAHNGPPPSQRYSGYFNARYGYPFSWFGGVWFF
jgi:hypothetical protein